EALVATATFDFVAEALALLESNRPLAILNPRWTETERVAREKILVATPQAETALILFTSGSSGTPKGVELSKRAIESNTDAVIKSLDFEKASHQILHLPLHYAYSLLGQLLPALKLGLTTRLLDGFNETIPLVRASRLDGMWSGVPSHYEALLRIMPPELDVEGVTHLVSAGAPFPVSLRRRLADRFPRAVIYNNYGMTECGPRILSFSSRHVDFFTEAAGLPVQGIRADVDTQGQLVVAGPQLMLGYLGDAIGTSERIENGWLKTGDLATLEAGGLVTVRGRMDDLVKIAGERVSLLEVEEAIRSVNMIDDAAVFVREHVIQGTQLVAFIVKKGSALDREGLIRELSKTLAATKIPRDYREIETLPRLDSGKIDRARLRAILANT
ncbi:MAG: fatty acid--CoA ligase family protein, partial [Bdellovibrionota bacterium]